MAATTAAVTTLASGASLAPAGTHAPAAGAGPRRYREVKMINLHRAYEQLILWAAAAVSGAGRR